MTLLFALSVIFNLPPAGDTGPELKRPDLTDVRIIQQDSITPDAKLNNTLYVLSQNIPTVVVQDTLRSMSVDTISSVVVTASLKYSGRLSQQPVAYTSLPGAYFEANRINRSADISIVAPNLYQADYGSKMTSSIYVRGIGSRMDQPAMGLYTDNVPILNKNNYDTEYFDIRQIDVLRGPQGTLYGRNTIGGVIDIRTLSPFDYRGTRASVGYGNGNTMNIRAATYQRPSDNFGWSVALNHHSSGGFFTNEYNGSSADRIMTDGGRFRALWRLSGRWAIDNILSLNSVKQNGFAYSLYDEATGEVKPISHNDPNKYDRFGLINGTTLFYEGTGFRLSSTTSYQYTNDNMILDQDFTPLSMFAMRQSQTENALTQEFVLKSNTEKAWQWVSGVFGFYKHISMSAPVLFKRDGIEQLILANANNGIHIVFPNEDLLIKEDEFPIESIFKLPAYGASLYHQSTYDMDRWKFTAGVRFDFENTSIDYHNFSDIHYRFTLTMQEYKLLPVVMRGESSKSYFELMPRFAATYRLDSGSLYAIVSRGYKAGGFNTQIFSDLLQNKMMNDLMDNLGVSFGDTGISYDPSKAISYKPEYSWNYEIGSHLRFLNNRLNMDISLFYIDCRNQQLTIFPPGQGTGRLMSNAGHTRSYGAEVSLDYRYSNLLLTANYGHTNARFLRYDDGNADYSGNYIPYAPQNTILLGCEYKIHLNSKVVDNIVVQADWRGVGKIYWNESNTLSQPLYGQLGASLIFNKTKYSVSLWAKNLTGTEFNTFYFKSVGNSFVQRGKPAQMGITLNVRI